MWGGHGARQTNVEVHLILWEEVEGEIGGGLTATEPAEILLSLSTPKMTPQLACVRVKVS